MLENFLVKVKDKKLLKIVIKFIGDRGGAHDISHILRVLKTCQRIQKKEGGDLRILEAMALLHDLIRYENKKKALLSPKHSAMVAKKILIKLKYNSRQIEKIVKGIRVHSLHSKKLEHPETIEEKILFDADKIDAAGRIGLIRWFYYCSNLDYPMDYAVRLYLKELKKVTTKNKNILYTKIGQHVIKRRVALSKKFLLGLQKELILSNYIK